MAASMPLTSRPSNPESAPDYLKVITQKPDTLFRRNRTDSEILPADANVAPASPTPRRACHFCLHAMRYRRIVRGFLLAPNGAKEYSSGMASVILEAPRNGSK